MGEHQEVEVLSREGLRAPRGDRKHCSEGNIDDLMRVPSRCKKEFRWYPSASPALTLLLSA